MKIIHCSVWGDIELSSLAIRIMDTPHFQRLHYIKQTGLAYKVFPTATSSRFEHSVGVYHVTRLLLDEIAKKQPEVMPSSKTQELLCLAGLIHDLGHGPFSHLFDNLLEDRLGSRPWCQHEHRSELIFRDLVGTYSIPLTDTEVDFILERIHDPPTDQWYDTLICNPISSMDTDKMDYVIRDSLHFGMKFNTDIFRILRNARVIDNQLCFCEKIYDELDLFFQIRDRMHRTIYRHPKIRYFETYLKEKLSSFSPPTTLEEFLKYNDVVLLQQLTHNDWMQIETRQLPHLKDFSSMRNTFSSDNQWNRARLFLKFFTRKDPTHSFSLYEPTVCSEVIHY